MKILFSFMFFIATSFASTDEFISKFDNVLSAVRKKAVSPPTCFVSRATNDPAKGAQDFFIGSLIRAGLKTIADEPKVEFLNETLNVDVFLPFGSNGQYFMDNIYTSNFVIVLNTQKYFERSNRTDPDAGVPQELERICRRVGQNPEPSFLVSLLLDGTKASSVPIRLSNYLFNPCTDNVGHFDQKLCCLQILLILQQKFYTSNAAILELVNLFINENFTSDESQRAIPVQPTSSPQQPVHNIIVARGIGHQVINGGSVTQNF